MSSLRWTEEDLERYERRTAIAVATQPAPALHSVVQAIGADIPREKRRSMNKTEAARALELEARRQAGDILEWAFEDTRLRLADGAWYKPDFRIVTPGGGTEFEEIKGFWREAARVRIKVAADRFPLYRFTALTRRRARDGGGWKLEAF